MSPAAAAMHCDRALRHRPARVGDEGPATPPLRQSVMRCASTPRGETTARGVSWCGTCVPCHDVTGHVFWSGSRTRDTRFLDRCSNRLSYPVVDEPESNRRPATRVAALTAELPPSRNTFSRTSAYATAGPRAPDGTQPVPLQSVQRCCVLAPLRAPIQCDTDPAAARAEHPGTAPWRLSADQPLYFGQRIARMLRDTNR